MNLEARAKETILEQWRSKGSTRAHPPLHRGVTGLAAASLAHRLPGEHEAVANEAGQQGPELLVGHEVCARRSVAHAHEDGANDKVWHDQAAEEAAREWRQRGDGNNGKRNGSRDRGVWDVHDEKDRAHRHGGARAA